MDFMKELVQGTTWKCRMWNGAIFEWWTPFIVKRTKAIKELLLFANGDYECVYTKEDIEQVWKTKGIRSKLE